MSDSTELAEVSSIRHRCDFCGLGRASLFPWQIQINLGDVGPAIEGGGLFNYARQTGKISKS